MLFGITGKTRLFLFPGSADIRKGFDGPGGLVINKLKQDPLSGDIFMFIIRPRTLIKLLAWDQNGFTIWHKRYIPVYSVPVVPDESVPVIPVTSRNHVFTL